MQINSFASLLFCSCSCWCIGCIIINVIVNLGVLIAFHLFFLIFLPEWQNGGGSIVRVWKPKLSLNFFNSCMLKIEYITWSKGFNRVFLHWWDSTVQGIPPSSVKKWTNPFQSYPSPIPLVNHSTESLHNHHQSYFYPLVIHYRSCYQLTFPRCIIRLYG